MTGAARSEHRMWRHPSAYLPSPAPVTMFFSTRNRVALPAQAAETGLAAGSRNGSSRSAAAYLSSGMAGVELARSRCLILSREQRMSPGV